MKCISHLHSLGLHTWFYSCSFSSNEEITGQGEVDQGHPGYRDTLHLLMFLPGDVEAFFLTDCLSGPHPSVQGGRSSARRDSLQCVHPLQTRHRFNPLEDGKHRIAH